MSLSVWNTRVPRSPEFSASWNARLARSPHANFSFDLRLIDWEASHGRHAELVQFEGPGLAAAFVLRESHGERVCGWPWRTQAVIEGPERLGPVGITGEETAVLFAHARELAGGGAVRWYSPHAPPPGIAGFQAGTTLMYSIVHEDDDLLHAMSSSKRRMVRKAQRLGYVVRGHRGLDDLRSFATLQQETTLRHGLTPDVSPAAAARPGERWREWELPWMWLLVAELEGNIESGLGDGVFRGGVLEARAGASSERARLDGAFALLSFEEVRQARADGYRWINLGGMNRFKREFAGDLATPIAYHAWLSARGLSAIRHRGEVTVRHARERARRVARRLRPARAPSLAAAAHPPQLERWSTREKRPSGFEALWSQRLSRCAHAHYAMRLDHLEWEARHGRHSIALLVGDPAAAVVLREERGGWVSGWPWRWQCVVEGGEGTTGITPAESSVLALAAERVVPGRRLEFFSPDAPAAEWPGFRAGPTIVLDITPEEDVLWKALDKSKQSSIKKGARDGLVVVVADRPEQFRAFHRLQNETEARRRADGELDATFVAPESNLPDPAPGEGWREWELPWHWLLVAERDGVVEAGSGFGFAPGGMLDYRTNASSLAGKKSGANFMLAWEAVRRGRELGMRRMNWGGATRFKRDMRGELVEIHCGLGGGPVWRLPNEFAAAVRRSRPRVAAWWRSLRKTGEGKSR
ncbi:MAG: GNAT family N-acetyltransferase [Candidatus Eisenbacteria bacterium]|uniref:GNAT family N-acetyltransferase n=1 Tax=Eiseniibacteriota bacterium TaxID=2212470 RepID=A0A849SQU3_UNCEI|nr:GNAT family N-acetyltransferase [Candidatus Eisenbacteria bacterium]